MNVLVTGGTGALGRDLVVALRSAGHRVRVMSRRPGTGADWAQGKPTPFLPGETKYTLRLTPKG